MQIRALILALTLLTGIANVPLWAEPSPDSGLARLRENVHFWQGRGRSDMVRESVNKLLAVAPNDAEGLTALCRLEVQDNHLVAARQALEKLREAHPNSPDVADLELLLSINGEEKAQLRQARQLANNSKVDLALKIYRKLFPGGPPEGEFAVEYWELVARTNSGWSLAVQSMEKLAREHPDDQSYRLSLAKLRTSRTPFAQKDLQTLIDMSSRPPPYDQEAHNAWRRVILHLEPLSSNTIPLIEQYLKSDPRDLAVKEYMKKVQEAQLANKKLMADPFYQAKREGLELLKAGQNAEAQEQFKKALTKYPRDPELVGGMGYSYMRESHYDAAEVWFKQALQLEPDEKSKWNALIKSSQFWGIMQQVGVLRDQEKYIEAEALLQQALQMDPQQPDALAAQIRIEADQSHFEEARKLAARLPKDRKQELDTSIDEIEAGQLRGVASLLRAQGDNADAITLLNLAMQMDSASPWSRYDLARLYAASGHPEQGQQLFDEMLAQNPKNASALYALALYQSGQDKTLKAMHTLEKVPKAERPGKIALLQKRLWLDLQLQRVKRLTKIGKKEEARKLLSAIEHKAGEDSDLMTTVAYAWADLGDQEHSSVLFKQILKNPAALSNSWHLRYARFLSRNHQESEYKQEVDYLNKQKLTPEEMQEMTALRDADTLHQVEQLVDNNKLDAAQRLLAPVLVASPNNRDALDLSSQIARKEGHLDKAIADLQHALAPDATTPSDPHALSLLDVQKDPTSGGETVKVDPATSGSTAPSSGGAYQYKKLAQMLDQRANWLSSAYDRLTRTGTPGQSQYDATEIPIEWRTPLQSGGQAFLRSDQVNIDAGTLNLADSYATKTFGSMLLCQPNCSNTLTQQTAAGRSYTVGYEEQDFRADLGTTPIGFLVTNWVGGIRQKGDLGPFSWSADFSRRPVAQTLLSYAGTRDPRTGAIWGGVVSTGANFGLSLDKGESFGFWSTFGLHRLTGDNVESNDWDQFMAGETWRIINDDNRLFSAGLTEMFWHFSRDAGEFTFGQGGYYSPQVFSSINLPFTYAERYTRFSYVVRASVFSSWAKINASPYFPLNGNYQSTAGNPYYATNSGPGSGYSAIAHWEYQMTPSLFLGNRFERERAPYYAPNSFIFYLRYAWDHAGAQPVFLQPEAVIPTSQF